ncbi:carboxylating nicotinate-nucleotide diphosphorylase [Heliophilum fasciatum]|uniref:Probable nicotinate-nucleotide pyrophosphorylase [carboxylating] n=1 Tax=Heliophilum fasciatum TaxID=35700 RepID=A0A4R2RZ69_9FIRM|nr:carboxylating nicotinate-nucleotide diphosphorylase [Heliophilum fasciatum]MCW2277075.1 nicotinate-nucleotide pyrophosphorylase (carboxylating) [Heliophilum fasciatum]TCP68399.1 nicotinate-nucleotide pyrophosphorylase [carboxylating] [Heliophilum fasciatum]
MEMSKVEWFYPQVRKIVAQALAEDVGSGDITAMSTVPAEATTRGIIHAKETGILAGIDVAALVFELMDRQLRFTAHKKDGEPLRRGDVIAEVTGSARSVLTAERVALNFLQHLSGIATKTARCAEKLTYYPAHIVDTRKTIPGLRVLEKYAVRVGGGRNHRFGLYDAVLIKDNHIRLAGGIAQAVSQARHYAPHTAKIEVEVEDLQQVAQALEANADIIMLDNMPLEMMREAVQIINGAALVEASGGVTEENLVDIAKTGVDFISMGALTHSARALDISLDVEVMKRGSSDGANTDPGGH